MTKKAPPIKTHRTCPRPECGAGGSYSVWADGTGYCHSCGHTSHGEASKEKPIKQKEYVPMPTDLTLKTHPMRGVDRDVEEFYGVQTGMSSSGDPVTRVYPYPHYPKTRVLPKDFSKNYGFTNDHLFGMDKFNAGSSKFLTVTEGEEDCLAAYQLLGKTFPVVSLPNAGTVKLVLQNKAVYDYMKAFSAIVIATDSDEAGNKSAELLQRAFPGRCYRVNMTTHKDASAYLQAGQGSDFKFAWINRQKYVPENVFNTVDQFEKIIRDDKGSMYIPTGIADLDARLLGLMQGHFTVLTAPEGIGKTELMRNLEYNLLSNHPTIPIASMHLEETQKRSLLGLASYFLHKDVTLQDTETIINAAGDEEIVYLPSYKGTPEDEVLQAIKDFTARENFYQFTLSVDDDPMSILDQIRYFAEVCGCRYVFFEPIQDLAYSRQNDSSIEGWLSELSTKLARLATELNVGIVSIAHENDDGQIRDCRMIGKRASVVIKLQRDKHAEDEETKNTTTMLVEKNRPVGPTGFGGMLEFDPASFTLGEKEF
jgi:twinkle protein